MQANILRLHVEDEGVGQGLLLAGGNGGLVLDGGQVAQDGGVGRGVRARLLGRHELAAQEGDLDGAVLIVGDIDDSLGWAAVDQFHAEDVGLGESSNDLGIQPQFRSVGNGLIVGDGGLEGGEERHISIIVRAWYYCVCMPSYAISDR